MTACTQGVTYRRQQDHDALSRMCHSVHERTVMSGSAAEFEEAESSRPHFNRRITRSTSSGRLAETRGPGSA